MELDLLTHRDHPLSSSQNISSHMSLRWPIKEGFMDYVRGDQEEHPYAVILKSGIEAKLIDCVEKIPLCVCV